MYVIAKFLHVYRSKNDKKAENDTPQQSNLVYFDLDLSLLKEPVPDVVSTYTVIEPLSWQTYATEDLKIDIQSDSRAPQTMHSTDKQYDTDHSLSHVLIPTNVKLTDNKKPEILHSAFDDTTNDQLTNHKSVDSSNESLSMSGYLPATTTGYSSQLSAKLTTENSSQFTEIDESLGYFDVNTVDMPFPDETTQTCPSQIITTPSFDFYLKDYSTGHCTEASSDSGYLMDSCTYQTKDCQAHFSHNIESDGETVEIWSDDNSSTPGSPSFPLDKEQIRSSHMISGYIQTDYS